MTPETRRILRKFRELQRDLLHMRFGDDWAKHEYAKGKFWDLPSDSDRAMIEIIGRYAELGEVPGHD